MSGVAYAVPSARWGARLTHGQMTDAMWEMLFSGSNLLEKKGYIMGQTAENLAQKYAISREEQDVFGFKSQERAFRGIRGGYFKDEIIPISIPQKKGPPIIFDRDESTSLRSTPEIGLPASPSR